jgi:hypothetical protein
MNRVFFTVGVVLMAAAVGRADLIPPGTKNIPIEHKIETDKEYPDWVFFVVRGSGGGQKAALDPKTPVVIPGSSAVGNGPAPQPGEKAKAIALPYRASTLVAVPKEALKKYAAEKDLLAAIEDAKVDGMVRVKAALYDHENAKATDARKSIVRRYRVTKIDAKDGIVLEAVKADGAPGKEEEEQAASPRAFSWIAGGLALAGALGFTGFWLLGRTRRREMGS